jgi:hypothetical protein
LGVFSGICNCVEMQKDQITRINKNTKPKRQNLLDIIKKDEKADNKEKSLTPIGSLLNLL